MSAMKIIKKKHKRVGIMCKKSPIMETEVDNTTIFEKIAVQVYNVKTENKIEKFSEITLDQLAKNNGNAIPCPDQYIGIIKVVKGKVVEFCHCFDFTVKENRAKNSKIISKMKHIPVMAIVLESPHQKEFDNKHAIGPAMGPTCSHFRFYFEEILEAAIANNQCELVHLKYRIVFVNAIQYQCSFGEDTKLYRDDIFSEMWENVNTRKDFIDRLESHNPEVIINCCTKGNFKDTEKEKHLRELVQKEINKYCKGKDILKLRAAHPSRWDIKRNRYIIKVK